MVWSFTTIPSEEWKNSLTTALVKYADNQSDENWELVSKAFVKGWEIEYRLQNGR